MTNHHNLIVWQRANAFSLAVHLEVQRVRSRAWPPGLRSQLLRAIGSIAANIAEGAGQRTHSQFSQFVSVAIGSANETETHLELLAGLALMPRERIAAFNDELQQIRRMLYGLRKHLERASERPVTSHP